MNSHQDPGSHLFLVRFWSGHAQEPQEAKNAGDRKEWSGRVQHVLSGEARTFHDWHTLIEMLLEMAETEGPEVAAQGPNLESTH